MRKLTNVYIEVTSRNVNELMKLIKRCDLKPNTYIFFNYECISSSVRTFVVPKNRKKVKLSVLKHLVDTIPTREEIISLKRQIGGYKTSYEKAVKHSLSKEDVIEKLQNNNSELIQKLINTNRDLKNKFSEIHRLKDDIKKVRSERDSLNVSFKKFNEMYDLSLKKLDIQADLIRDKNAQIKKLKQRKWWQIWKR